MNIWNLIFAIVGTAEKIVPIFVHNQKSQEIEAVIMTTVNTALTQLASPLPKAAPAAPASAATAAATDAMATAKAAAADSPKAL